MLLFLQYGEIECTKDRKYYLTILITIFTTKVSMPGIEPRPPE